MHKKYIALLWLIFTFVHIGFSQNPLEDEKSIDLQSWKPTGWQTVGDFVISPLTFKSKTSHGSGVFLAEKPAVLSYPVSLSSYLMSFEYLIEPKAAAEMQFLGQNKLGLALGEIGRIQTTKGNVSPEINVERTLGLWQKVELSIEDAPNMTGVSLINYIKINEVLVHQHVLQEKGTAAENFIKIYLNSGKMAIKNMKILEQTNIKPLQLKNIKAEVWDKFDWETISTGTATSMMKADLAAINHDIGQDLPKKNFIIKYDADLNVDKEGIYNLSFDFAGKYKLLIDNKLITDFKSEFLNRKIVSHKLNLAKGIHTFHLEYEKVWLPAALGVFVSGNGAKTYALHESTSLPANSLGGKIIHNPNKNTEIIRGFYMHNGVKNTTAMAVGFPSKYNYAIDVERGDVMTVWKGDFIDITEMWLDRGEPQIFTPEGMISQLQATDMLQTANHTAHALVFKGYNVDAQQTPTFSYVDANGLVLEKTIQAVNNKLQVDLKFNNIIASKAIIAKGKQVSKIEKNLYKIDQIFVFLDDKLKPEIVKKDAEEMLQVPVRQNISYQLAW